jgi:ABC-type transport system involved in multi-copper enzyme maturation permease subunit
VSTSTLAPTIAHVRALTAFELRGATRTRWVAIGGAVFAAASLAVVLAGMRSLAALGLGGAGAATDGLVHLALLLPPLIGLLLGAGSLARDRERGMLSLLASQPVPRALLPVAGFLGATLAVWALIALGLGLGMLLIATVATMADLAAMAVVLGISLIAAASAVALGVAISAVSETHHQATAAAASLWLLLALGLDLLLAGVAPGLRLGPAGLLGAVLVNPIEAARVLALLLLDGEVALGPFGAYLTRTFGAGGSIALLLGTLYLWTAGPLLLAAAVTRRRDA